jgi:hypothetical protein
VAAAAATSTAAVKDLSSNYSYRTANDLQLHVQVLVAEPAMMLRDVASSEQHMHT